MTPPRAADDGEVAAAGEAELSASRKWLLTFSVMVVAVMQVLDTSVTNVALPHMQGSLSASVEEVAWVITSYLAANAVVIPATGWLTAYFGRRKFFLVCTVLFTVSSFLSGIAPNLETLVLMRVLQGLGGGPVIPMSQAILWEIRPAGPKHTASFPMRRRSPKGRASRHRDEPGRSPHRPWARWRVTSGAPSRAGRRRPPWRRSRRPRHGL